VFDLRPPRYPGGQPGRGGGKKAFYHISRPRHRRAVDKGQIKIE